MPKTKREAVPRKNVRIPKPLMDEVDRIVRESGLYINRQQFIESAIRERIENIKLVGEIDDDLSVHIKDTFLAHAIMGMVKEKAHIQETWWSPVQKEPLCINIIRTSGTTNL